MAEGATIRPVREDDLEALYEICLLTGDSGQDATPLHGDRKLLGHLYAAPYAVLEPDTSTPRPMRCWSRTRRLWWRTRLASAATSSAPATRRRSNLRRAYADPQGPPASWN